MKQIGKQIHTSVDQDDSVKSKNVIAILKTFGLGILLLASLWVFGISLATGPTSTTGVVSCGAAVSNYTYKVPFKNSPWNIPACDLAPYGKSTTIGANFGKRIYDYGMLWNADNQYEADRIASGKGKFQTQFGLAGDSNDYSTPIYHATANTPTARFKMCNDANCWPSNLEKVNCWDVTDVACMAPNVDIPYDPSWRPSGDTDGNLANNAFDREMIIVDDRAGPTNGFVYEIWQFDRTGNTCLFGRTLIYAVAGRSPESRICVGSINTLRDNTGKQLSIYDYQQGVVSDRGMGIQNTAMIVTPEEVSAGEIRHALTMEGINVMFGPACDTSTLTIDSTIVSKTCGYAVAPSGQFEWKDALDISRNGLCDGNTNKFADYPNKTTFKAFMTQDKMVPEGMRFRLQVTDVEIENWLTSRTDLKGETVNTARKFAKALRDYGWIIGDQTCYGAGFTVAGAANPDAKTKWQNLGIAGEGSQHLLDGLFTASNIMALDPPLNTCVDGKTTKFYCPWINSAYPTASTTVTPPTPTPTPPPPTPAPSPTPTPAPQPPSPMPVTPPIISTPPPATTSPAPLKGSFDFGFNWSKFEMHGKLNLTWSAATSPNTIAKYRLYKGTVLIYEGPNLSYTDWNVGEGSNFSYQVLGVDTKDYKTEFAKFNALLHDCSFGVLCKLN